MAEPGNFDIILHRNVTKTITFNLKDSAGAAFDLTGYTVMADAVGTILPSGRLELSPTISAATSGQITITLSKSTTGSLVSTDGLTPTEIPKWDMLIDKSGTTSKILEGKLYIHETLTT